MSNSQCQNRYRTVTRRSNPWLELFEDSLNFQTSFAEVPRHASFVNRKLNPRKGTRCLTEYSCSIAFRVRRPMDAAICWKAYHDDRVTVGYCRLRRYTSGPAEKFPPDSVAVVAVPEISTALPVPRGFGGPLGGPRSSPPEELTEDLTLRLPPLYCKRE